MISLIAQERLLGFALGGAFVGVTVLEQRRAIRRSIPAQNLAPASPEQEKLDVDMVNLWNKAVDRSLAPLIAALSSRGW
ncbi:unnamed protein product [Spirodela intermedia]|uniref:Uncharacterized protein n=1 Tax=Spirodela intermedia TaxID=51605 RepID=A0A7I8IDS7_SPIIN|nr:unnamed protein product [Spirodela intermedia]CAA6655243.1 unnamed protein product [Spirodela intermedia]